MSGVCEVFVEAVEMFGRLTERPMTLKSYQAANGKPWQHEFDGWCVAINTDDAEREAGPADGMRCAIPAMSVGVWWNGWFAGIINSNGGFIAAGEAANEDTLLAAMRRVAPPVLP